MEIQASLKSTAFEAWPVCSFGDNLMTTGKTWLVELTWFLYL